MVSLIGSKVERKEDKKFLTGKGRYTADINLVNQTYAYFVRSPHARAKINSVDISKALKAVGVVNIFTGEDIVKENVADGVALLGCEIVPKTPNRLMTPQFKCPITHIPERNKVPPPASKEQLAKL